MKLSKIGLWFLAAYLLWAAFWYSGYRECPNYPSGGIVGISLGCEWIAWVATIPVQSIIWWIGDARGMTGSESDQAILHAWLPYSFVLCCILYYALGAGIGWLRRPRKR